MSKKIYCIEEQFPDNNGVSINQVELPVKDGWQFIGRFPYIHEYYNEETFKHELINMLNNNILITKIYIKEEDDYKILDKF